MRFDRYEEPRKRTHEEWLAVAESWLLGALFLALIIAVCVVLCVLEASAAAVPPRPRLARHLTGERIAAVVAAAPDGAKISVPTGAMREWSAVQHVAGDTCSYSGAVYVCVQGHRALPGWQPPAVPALWRLVRAAGETGVPAWRQPLGAHDAYQVGDRVNFEGAIYESIIPNNVWSPSAYPAGWKSVSAGGDPPAPPTPAAWKQPTGAHGAYALGARVQHAGKTWESTVAANVWAPGVYGWKEVEN